jgi:hypothetical protein
MLYDCLTAKDYLKTIKKSSNDDDPSPKASNNSKSPKGSNLKNA